MNAGTNAAIPSLATSSNVMGPNDFPNSSVNSTLDGEDEEGPEWDADSSYDLEGMDGYGDTEDDDE